MYDNKRQKQNIGELGCGYQGSGLICCPQVSESPTLSPGKLVDGQRCGISQVQGEGYDGLGAYPWVARVGFRRDFGSAMDLEPQQI
ncbi:hypothetical protein NQ318_012992 [Aromia moschata]|uniref:Uncharacterized protein n=1 Tax=Aromia moschata TaxID=1265417 RepID=A0AAV8Y0X6_9CUCU|nr:hypothetical protein NQ318_012992 [Aromia moschata]